MRKYLELILDLGSGHSSLVKIPLRTASRLMFALGIVFILAILSTGGWLMSRWRLHQSAEDLGFERMKTNSLEAKLKDLQQKGIKTPENQTDISAMASSGATVLPSLDSDELQLPGFEVKDIKVEIFPAKKELHLQFELSKTESTQVPDRFYALGLLHGSQGILHLPPTLASRKGDPVLFHRGLALNDVRTRRGIRQVFLIGDFLERTQGEPVFLTLLIYDNKGTMIFKKRVEPLVRRIDGSRASVNGAAQDREGR
jgi:hypothetical protein